ncbi:MAG: response regulator transcription factor [Phycisphaerae bacterium]|nr:response regulator transcription factor [Phycisphaerae bacterium]
MDNVKATVFVVDDDEAICKSLAMLIEGAGLNAQAYSSAQDFLDDYDPAIPGCLLLDVRMPGMNGLELQAELAKRRIHIPTIVITGHADVPMAVQTVKSGAMSFIEKPFGDKALLDDIRKAIALDAKSRRVQMQ